MNNDDKIKIFKELIERPIIPRNSKKIKYKLTQKQAKKLLEYAKYQISKKHSDIGISTVIRSIKNFCSFIRKDFEKVTKKDIGKFVNEKSDLKPNSYNTYQQRIKEFFKWFYDYKQKGKYPELVDWIEIKATSPEELTKDELLSWEETRNVLIPVCQSFRDKCLIALMRETGARINEIINANVSDVSLEKDKAFIKLRNSKRRNNEKSYRNLVLLDTFYYLENWLRDHPLKSKFKENKEIPLFVNRKSKRIVYHDVSRILRKIEDATNLDKKLYPHLFRHSQANDMAKILTDAELRVFGGWVKTSAVIGRYTHLTSDDVNNKRLKSIGRIQEQEERIIEKLEPCSRCNEMIDMNKFTFCGKCGMALRKEDEIKNNIVDERLSKHPTEREIYNIVKDKEFQKIKKELKGMSDIKEELSYLKDAMEKITKEPERYFSAYDEELKINTLHDTEALGDELQEQLIVKK